MTTNQNKKKRFEFSKLLVGGIFIIYVIAFIVASKCVLEYPDGLAAYLTYAGGQMGLIIGFYMWKSKAENVVKIKKSTGIDIPMNDGSNNSF